MGSVLEGTRAGWQQRAGSQLRIHLAWVPVGFVASRVSVLNGTDADFLSQASVRLVSIELTLIFLLWQEGKPSPAGSEAAPSVPQKLPPARGVSRSGRTQQQLQGHLSTGTRVSSTLQPWSDLS